MTRLIDIDGSQVFVVICWMRHMASIVGVRDSEEGAKTLIQEWINTHPDPEWEKTSGERRNNTWFEPHFINATINK